MVSRVFFGAARRPWFVFALLALVTLGMHHSALNGFWRFDDGWHLGFAACYSPWEYFLVPGITREISYANLTPWNPLTYDINLMLFGLNPTGYYAHQLFSLWLAACASFLLLRLWVGSSWAVFGAALFLVGTPTVHIAQELMTGHYLEGLFFAAVAIYGFVRAMRSGSKHWLGLGVLGYILACTCKEVYVPVPAVLFVLPEGDWKKRLRFVAPFLVVALLYLYWRAAVLGTIVGGADHEGNTGFSLGAALLTYAKVPTLLLGHTFTGYLALIALAMLLALNTSPRGWLLVLVAAAALLLPLAPLAVVGFISRPNRLFFAVWWAVALGVAVAAGRGGGRLGSSPRIVAAALIGVAAVQAGRAETKAVIVDAKPTEALYKSALMSINIPPEDTILPPTDMWGDYPRLLYDGFATAAIRCGIPITHPELLSSVEALAAIDPNMTRVYRYDFACGCMKDVTSVIPTILSPLPRNARRRTLRTLFSPSPYRPRRDQQRITDTNPHGGIIESIKIVGDSVEITGWARLRDDEPEQSIVIFVAVHPINQRLVSIERPDIAKRLDSSHYLNTGFLARLQFATSSSAAYAAGHICALKDAGGSFAPIENPANRECSALFRQQVD